jgi:hypothetical protein
MPSAAPSQSSAPSSYACSSNPATVCRYGVDENDEVIMASFSICVHEPTKKGSGRYKSQCVDKVDNEELSVGDLVNGNDYVVSCGCCTSDEGVVPAFCDEEKVVNCPMDQYACGTTRRRKGADIARVEYCVSDKKGKVRNVCGDPFGSRVNLKSYFKGCGENCDVLE